MTDLNYCPTCGAALEYKEAEICPHCGVRIRSSSSEERYAGFWIRFAAYILDGIVLLIPTLIIVFIALSITLTSTQLMGNLFSLVAGLIISWLYFALQESSKYQATLGKRGAGVMVVNAEGERITLGQATIRWIIKAIPILNLISYIILAIDEKKQGLHDKAAGTFVVNKQR
ncbi:MAG: RDD family protein [Methanospirillum sp.]|uniref:RDD family protein n=1 Tax=Methanospirillum sp. TaxID=45200 RepID=UPI0023729D6B|nr:RDD family protein [Methanospirillum sp.]MDD1728416.1 RDD family protein [Methanospirillum sp.]